jgi:hypothetical protein
MKQTDYQVDTSALERQIDEKVFELYGLSSDEIGMVYKAIQP